MKALPNDNWREFVRVYCQQGGRDAGKAYALAFGHDPNDPAKKNSNRVSAHRLSHDERVLQAIQECEERSLRGLAPLARKAIERVLDDDDAANADRINAFKAVADRVGLHARTEHRMTIEHIDDPERLQRLAELAARMGVDLAGMVGSRLASKAPMIDLTPTSITVANKQHSDPEWVDDEY